VFEGKLDEGDIGDGENTPIKDPLPAKSTPGFWYKRGDVQYSLYFTVQPKHPVLYSHYGTTWRSDVTAGALLEIRDNLQAVAGEIERKCGLTGLTATLHYKCWGKVCRDLKM